MVDQGDPDELGPDPFVELYKRRGGRVKPGLSRMQAALDLLDPGLPPQASILIAGTNGKGSTAAYVAILLAATGRRVGLYTSPHLERFSERFAVIDSMGDGSASSAAGNRSKCWEGALLRKEAKLQRLLDQLQRVLPAPIYHDLSFFELTTLLGFAYFRKSQCDVVVLEVGLGGRFDATNVVQPAVSIITSIGLDHCEFLGTKLSAIAAEKAGVMRAGRPVLWSGNFNSQEAAFSDWTAATDPVEQAIDAAARQTNAKLLRFGRDWTRSDAGIAWTPSSYFADLSGKTWRYPPSLQSQADYLKKNFAVALAATAAWWKESGLQSEVKASLEGLIALSLQNCDLVPRPACLQGRFEVAAVLSGGGHVILDVCHNPSGAAVFAHSYRAYQSLQYQESSNLSPVILVSTLRDKDISGISEILSCLGSDIFWIDSSGERAFSADRRTNELGVSSYFESLEAALIAIAPKLRDQPRDLLICGSVHMMGLWRPSLGRQLLCLGLLSSRPN